MLGQLGNACCAWHNNGCCAWYNNACCASRNKVSFTWLANLVLVICLVFKLKQGDKSQEQAKQGVIFLPQLVSLVALTRGVDHLSMHFLFWGCFLKSSIFIVQRAAAPKNGIEFRQKSIGAVRCSLATSYDDWRRRATSILFSNETYTTDHRPRTHTCWTGFAC